MTPRSTPAGEKAPHPEFGFVTGDRTETASSDASPGPLEKPDCFKACNPSCSGFKQGFRGYVHRMLDTIKIAERYPALASAHQQRLACSSFVRRRSTHRASATAGFSGFPKKSRWPSKESPCGLRTSFPASNRRCPDNCLLVLRRATHPVENMRLLWSYVEKNGRLRKSASSRIGFAGPPPSRY